MAQHAILRFEKHKGNPARPLEAHHERQKEQYASNPDIDTSRSKYNFHIVKPEGRYYHFIQSRIEQAGCRTRKDSTRFVDTLVTASPEFFKGKSPKEIQAFFQRAADFLIGRVGKENIVSAVVHMDEKTPHLHLVFVPLTEDNRLCAKEIIGNRANLTKWQDDFHAYMVEKYPDLERGESASKTGRKHIPTRLFKQAVSLSKQARAIEAALDGINPLNAGKKKEEALSMLKKWFPQMENFSGQLKKYKVTINDLLAENEKLEARAKASEKGKMKDTMERAKLESELHAVKKTITNVYQKKCGDAMSVEDISQAMDKETWMGADEALTFGFIDEIDNNFAIKTNMKSDTLIVNSVALPTKGRNMDKITSIIDKRKGENMKDNEMISKIKAVLGIKESEDPKVAAERQRIAALDDLRTEDKNPYVEAIIDTCKKTEGVEVKTVKPIIDSILAVKVENKPDEKIEAIMKIIQDNVDSGANGVKPTPQHNPEDNEHQKLEADISDIVNRANKIRGNK